MVVKTENIQKSRIKKSKTKNVFLLKFLFEKVTKPVQHTKSAQKQTEYKKIATEQTQKAPQAKGAKQAIWFSG
ncbi:hypothetical protein CAPN001_00900 [Capnocytophaga stomatis]|nr:hypothetical protein CAPN001_00900 [Capnocytophaga stomatis]GIM49716.1 hypothetical protein CAPN003_11680 [Capnocytophaga stomatis]